METKEKIIKSESGTYDGFDEVYTIIMDECMYIQQELMSKMENYFTREFKSDLLDRLKSRGLELGVHIDEISEIESNLYHPIEPYFSDETETEMIETVKIIY